MPTFKPFKGVRPKDSLLQTFPTRALDNFSGEEILKKSQQECSYVNMVKPYVCSKSKDVARNLRKVRNNYEVLLNENQLIRDETSYYLYEQTMPDKSTFRGLLGLVSVDDFWNGKIKKHESTLTHKKEKLAYYLQKVNIQAEPVLLTYNANPKIEMLMNHEEKNIPILNVTSDDGVKHKIWKINNLLKLQQLKEVLDQVDSFYIADGHHRMGSAAFNAKNQREKSKKVLGTEGYNYVYSFIVSNQSIKIYDYNRVIKDLNGLSEEKFFAALEKYFYINKKGNEPYYPSQKHHISMYLEGEFYSLHVKHDLRPKEQGLDCIDHYLLEKYILKPILKIEDSKTSNRIKFVKGNSTLEGIELLKAKVDSGEFKVAFGLYPVSCSDLMKVSDLKQKMPPKSTLISPKLMTALIMYDMK
ncbi:DUF1015 domain-containing protein [Riemerella columbipharyngis]|uniref:Uncharacterized conserved protein, DUF1015 family n=1 Tax=Riemerella columbipharyngis TaxID=1071918 RepID=A0A1G7DU10_9FLAO|nr:DUF1015 domain-containing protein [Riemerella columbipharyngis]SDE54435.1 Uncharacterized conserved protein, DUF1015 family [Riemerella columbipharyngis]